MLLSWGTSNYLLVMADDLAEVMKKFDLSSRESEEVDLSEEDAGAAREECRMSLFGKVMGDRVTNFTGIKSFVNHMWGYPKDMVAVEIGVNLYQFSFTDQQCITKILNGRPYVIDNQLLNIKEWEEDIEGNPKAFSTSPLWVQLWNLPVHWNQGNW